MGVPVKPDIDLILERLREGRLDSFLNSFEWGKFECKASPYQLDSNDQKFELAKDVSAMANVDGGVILIGAKTAQTEIGRSEIVTEINPFPSDLVDTAQMIAVLREWLYPPLRELHIAWYPSAIDKPKGVVAIHVPRASDDLRPIIVARTYKETGKLRGNAFGLFERWQDEITFFNAEQLHALIRSGRNSQIVLQRFDALQATLEVRPPPGLPPIADTAHSQSSRASMTGSTPRNSAVEAISAAAPASYLADVGLSSLSAYVLRGIPMGHVSVPGIFATQQSPVRALVQDPPKLRFGSFGVDGGGSAHIYRGYSWRSEHDEAHRLLEINANGQVVFVAPADETFLCWGKHQSEEAKRLNPVVLIESVYLFAELLRQLQALTDPENVGYLLRIEFKRFKQLKTKLVLSPGLRHAYGVGLDLHEAPEDNKEFDATWVQGKIVPEELAYSCLAQVYVWFSLTHDRIPLARDSLGKRVIDVEAIKQLRS